MAKAAASMIIALFSILLAGCWDRVEVEERGFVIGVAVDAQSSEKDGSMGRPFFVLTTQLVVPGAMSIGMGNSEGNNEMAKAFVNVSATGETLLEAHHRLTSRFDRAPFFPHNKNIIISEELARNGQFANVIDYFIRDQEMRRKTNVLIAKGIEARNILDVRPKTEMLPSNYIDKLFENQYLIAALPKPLSIGALHKKLLNNSSFIVPAIISSEDEVDIASVAVFHGKNNQLIGYLDDRENKGLKLLLDKVIEGSINIAVRDNLIAYRIKKASVKVSADVSDIDNIRFNFTVKVEGMIIESLETIDYLRSNEVIWNLEEIIEGHIEEIAEAAIDKVHRQFKVDVLELDTYLRTRHPKTWKLVKDNWDHGTNYFSKSTIEVNADAVILIPGAINQSEPIQDR